MPPKKTTKVKTLITTNKANVNHQEEEKIPEPPPIEEEIIPDIPSVECTYKNSVSDIVQHLKTTNNTLNLSTTSYNNNSSIEVNKKQLLPKSSKKELMNLKELYLGRKDLEMIPEELTEYIELRILWLNHNKV